MQINVGNVLNVLFWGLHLATLLVGEGTNETFPKI